VAAASVIGIGATGRRGAVVDEIAVENVFAALLVIITEDILPVLAPIAACSALFPP
jgi:hypothetical protein